MINKKDENYIYYLVAQNLKKQRKLKGLTQSQLAEKCSYSDGFIMNIESEKYHQTFSLGTLWTFAKVLGIDIRELFAPHRRKQVKVCITSFLMLENSPFFTYYLSDLC